MVYYRKVVEPAFVRPSVRAPTLSNVNISNVTRPIVIKFCLKHHWGEGKVFGRLNSEFWIPWQQIAPID